MTCKSCNNNITAGIAPAQATVNKEVTENHTVVFSNSAYAAGIEIVDDFNIPAIGEDVAVKIRGAYNIPVGAYFYHAAYGHLKIGNWNCNTNTVGLLNENIKGTAAPGTFVPACTLFIVTAKPCCEDDSSSLFPFVREDFIAPAVGVNTVIEVTSVFGLQVDQLIRIGSGIYELVNINSSNQIVIVNNGGGITPGTLVEALNAEGDYQYLITMESVSLCSSATETEGRLLICNGADERILGGDFVGQVPILRNETSEEVSFGLLDATERLCTVLTSAVNVTSADPTYTIDVDDVTGFVIGDILQLNFGTLRFEITAIGATTFDVTTIPNPPAVNISIPLGSAVCKILTTESLQSEVDVLQTEVSDLQTDVLALQGDVSTLEGTVEALENRTDLLLTFYVKHSGAAATTTQAIITDFSYEDTITPSSYNSFISIPTGMALVINKLRVYIYKNAGSAAGDIDVILKKDGTDIYNNTFATGAGASSLESYPAITNVVTAAQVLTMEVEEVDVNLDGVTLVNVFGYFTFI